MPKSKSLDGMEIPEDIFRAEESLWQWRMLPDSVQDSMRQDGEQVLIIAKTLSDYREYFAERLGSLDLADERFRGLCEAAVRLQMAPIGPEPLHESGRVWNQRDPPRWGNSQTAEEELGQGPPSYEQALEDAVSEAEAETTQSTIGFAPEPQESLHPRSVRNRELPLPLMQPAEESLYYEDDVPGWLFKMLREEELKQVEEDEKFALELQRQSSEEYGISNDAGLNALVSKWTIEEKKAQMEDDMQFAVKLQLQLEEEGLPSKEEKQVQEEDDAAFAARLQREAEEADMEEERQRTKFDVDLAARLQGEDTRQSQRVDERNDSESEQAAETNRMEEAKDEESSGESESSDDDEEKGQDNGKRQRRHEGAEYVQKQ